ncbi:MAG: DUF2275 domain-containing protein [Deltaproteobacteria bacterium]|nr:DUF2275 domain-containing protein [Deltaproteobacteria bacterium]
MTCNEINKRLPAYLENDLTPEDKKIVEDHLATCDTCHQALAEFKMTLSLLKDLPEVEPPPFYEQKIMARIHEDATSKSGILKKLFYPFRIKIPLQAMVTICIAVFAFLIYQGTEQDVKQTSPLPLPNIQFEERSSAPYSTAHPAPLPIGKEEPASPRMIDSNQSAASRLHPTEDKELSDKKTISSQPSLQKSPSPVVKSKERNQEEMVDEIERPEKKEPVSIPLAGSDRKFGMAYLETKPEREGKTSGEPMTAGEGLPGAVSPSVSRDVMRHTINAGLMDLSLHVTDIDAAVREIENYIDSIHGRVIESREIIGNGFIKVEVNSGVVPALLERLKQIGQVRKGEERPLPSEEKAVVLIKVIRQP